VIDGGSVDGSIDLIESYKQYLNFWITEKDNGIYNAMNKGIDVCNSEYILFLNSGDSLISDNIIEEVYNELKEDIVYGNLAVNNKHIKKYPDLLDEKYLLRDSLPHPSSFIKTKILKENKYNENYKIISDWIFFYEQIINNKISYRHIGTTISNFMLGGVSSNKLFCLMEKRRYLESIYYEYKIGIVIPCYNQGKYIKETIDSLKASTYKNFQCVIINDGSTDNSDEIIKKEIENDKRFEYFIQKNKGLSNARNTGIKKLNSKYILCLDSDDKISETYIENGIKYLEENDNISIYYGKAKFFFDNGLEVDWNLPEFNYKNLLENNHIYCSYIYRRREYNETGGYDENMKGYEDWDFIIRLLNGNKKVFMTNDTVFFYRRHDGSMDSIQSKKIDEYKKYIREKNIEIYKKYENT
jgi:glycosyltransferase involved in cell wall biosynthesis